MIDAVLRLAELLRSSDIDVSTGEVLDALAVVEAIDLVDADLLREGLRSAMVKRADDDGVFDRHFTAVFRAGATGGSAAGDATGAADAPGGARAPAEGPPAPSAPELSAGVLAALLAGDDDALAALAGQAVDRLAGMDGIEGSDKYFLHRVLRAIDISRMLTAAMQQLRRAGELDELGLMLERGELVRRLDAFRRRLAAVIAARRAGDAGLGDVAMPERTRVEDLDLMRLSRSDLDDVRRLLQPLVRRLAARVAHRRRPTPHGRLDARRTVRRSLQAGGVPLDVVMRRPHPHRPDVVLLCDLSGSVAEFATFTLTMVNAVHAELRQVRSFAFVDGIAEVSDLFATTSAGHVRFDLPISRLTERTGVIGADGHSDYGRVFDLFVARHLDDAVDRRTTVVITGDARGNHRDSKAAALAQIHDRARRVFWLNPEPREQWGEDDSLIDEYRPHCTSIHEVRTLSQLADAIAALV